MKKIFGFLFFALIVSLFSKAGDSTFTISGKFDKVKSGLIYLYIYEGATMKKDSSKIQNGHFAFKGFIQKPSTAILDLKDNKQSYFKFYVEPVSIILNGIGDSLELFTIKGSPINDDDTQLMKRMEFIKKWEDANSKLFAEASKVKNKELMDSLDEVDNDILKEKRKVVSQFVKDYPHSMRSAMAIAENYAYYAEADEVEPLYNLLDKNLRKSETGSDIKKMIDVYKTVAIGKVAPEIIQSSPEGKDVALSSLKGKYVLVDFWASWCGPCRRENPNVVNTYNQFKDKGFEIFGVSYDTKKTNWEKAIKDDKLVWQQVSALNGWKNPTSETYGIKAIPSNLLLNKDGKIIAKNIFGKKLVVKLSEILNHSVAAQ